MQNRYTGDIGDFGKLGILRQLNRIGLSVGVNWYLTPDETHNGDGRHIEYLQKRDFGNCDETLWYALKQIVNSGSRQVSALESSGLLQARYYSNVLDFTGISKPMRDSARWEWHILAYDRLRGCDIVFLDPDNGIIVPSEQGTPKSNKFVLPFELVDYYRAGSSVVYYQHKARRPDEFYVDQHNQLLHSGAFPEATGFGLKFHTTSQRYYFFIVHAQHVNAVGSCVHEMTSGAWQRHFSVISGL